MLRAMWKMLDCKHALIMIRFVFEQLLGDEWARGLESNQETIGLIVTVFSWTKTSLVKTEINE